VHLLPQGGEYFFRCNLQEKFVKCTPAHQVHPQAEQESIFRIFLCGGGDLEVGVVLFSSTPRQNPGYAYATELSSTICDRSAYWSVVDTKYPVVE